MLEVTKDLYCSILTAIVSQPLRHHNVPNDWKIVRVIQVFKDDGRNSSLHYRPTNLTSLLSKVLEHKIHSHAINFLYLTMSSSRISMISKRVFHVKRDLQASSSIFIHKLIFRGG